MRPDERMCVCVCVCARSSSPNAFFSHSDAGWRMMVKLSLSAATIVEAPVSMWRLSYVDSALSQLENCRPGVATRGCNG